MRRALRLCSSQWALALVHRALRPRTRQRMLRRCILCDTPYNEMGSLRFVSSLFKYFAYSLCKMFWAVKNITPRYVLTNQ